MALHENGYDPDGHAESIECLADLLKDNSFCGRSALRPDVVKEIVEARDNRVVADYSPFEQSRYPNGSVDILITGLKWEDAAKFNIDLADKLLVSSIQVAAS